MNTRKYYTVPETGRTIGYLEYIPQNTKPEDKLPLVICLHGAGERGTDLSLVAVHGFPEYTEKGEEFPFVLISPQCPCEDYWGCFTESMNLFLDYLLKTLPVDPKRVILSGLSMGGMGTLMWAYCNADRFAALVPVCAPSVNWLAYTLINTPIWAFHGECDDCVDCKNSIDLYNTVKALGGNIKLTTYPGVGHNSWDYAYREPDLVPWILEQKLK